jgi:hypothetical protein
LAPATSSSSVCHTRRRAVHLRVVSFLTVVLLTSAAPSGAALAAALPEDGTGACGALSSELVYIGQAGTPFRYRLFHEQIDRAREVWLKAKAAHERSPKDIDLLIAYVRADAEHESWTIRSFEMTLVPMTIERVFRGHPAAESFVVLKNEMNIEPGRSYVFAGENPFASLGFNFHEGWTRDVLTAPQGLRVLEGATTSGGGTIYGALNVEHTSGAKGSSPLAGVSIRLTVSGYVDQVVTDKDGTFVVSNVPAGVVTMTPLIPDQFAITNRALLVPTVAGGRCTSIDLLAALNGRIRGRITDSDGKPRTGLPIQLLPTGYRGFGPPSDGRYRVSTNDRGEFEFSAIPPGSYLVGHQIHRSDAIPSGGFPPSTYFPGVTSRVGATPVVVGNATVHNGIDFTVVW